MITLLVDFQYELASTYQLDSYDITRRTRYLVRFIDGGQPLGRPGRFESGRECRRPSPRLARRRRKGSRSMLEVPT